MKSLLTFSAIAVLTVILPTNADAAMEVIYKVSGVTDNGGPINTGVATAIHCTNFSAIQAKWSVSFKNKSGISLGGGGGRLMPGHTETVATRGTNLFNVISPGVTIQQGSAIVESNSKKIHCSAMIVDAAATVPQGIALHMVRYNPLEDTEE